MDLKELRAHKGYQRKFVVEKICISSKHLNDIEAGRVNLTDRVANKLSIFYDLDVDEIKSMYMEGKMKREEILKKQSKLLKEIDTLSQKNKNNLSCSKKITTNSTANSLI